MQDYAYLIGRLDVKKIIVSEGSWISNTWNLLMDMQSFKGCLVLVFKGTYILIVIDQ